MPPRGATVRIRLDRLRRFLKDLDQGFLGQRDTPEVEAVLMQWRSRYLGFVRRRFVQYSRGGGDWRPLALSTIQRRRRGRGRFGTLGNPSARGAAMSLARVTRRGVTSLVSAGGRFAILRDTGTMFATLEVGRPDNFRRVPRGVRVGFLSARPAKQRTGRGVKDLPMSIAELAEIHQFGKGRVPARPMIVDPDQRTVSGMIRDLKRGVIRLAQRRGQ